MNPLLQRPRPGVSETYRLIWAPYIPAFAVVESEEELGAEWWLAVPLLPTFAARHPSWDGPEFFEPFYMVDVVGVLSERGSYGPNGDHVRKLDVETYSNVLPLPCGYP